MIQLDGHYVSLAVRAAGTEIHDLPEGRRPRRPELALL